ncbi:Subtilase family protein [Aquisphaera giovannonii]|uniref:Subtilase family protein n=1 Tax=Aquisphaera giovannonii TaxID=406548 RepID=A0A5B9W339_9BACT|nr:S8 family peptidase [Aquisphaera giovannonii]QEH35002.1 Subtilase family protein [Aquisphaera giovannonii]
MAVHPLLFFPPPAVQPPAKRGGGGGKIKTPTPEEQRARLDAKFRHIAKSFAGAQTTSQGLEPEQVVVFETLGISVDGLAKAAAAVPGLEWLSEIDLEDVAPGEGFEDAKEPAAALSCRLYALMSNQQAITQLIGLWGNWLANPGERAKNNFGPFKTIFIHLKDIRRWGVKDRLAETQVVEYWKERLEDEDPKKSIRFEVELWCRGEESKRRRAYDHLRRLVTSAGGQCVTETTIAEILYHGVLVDLPREKVRDTFDSIMSESYSQLLRCEDVMLFRPLGQSSFPALEIEDGRVEPAVADSRPLPAGKPVVALLDGLPLEHHDLLEGRLVIDDENDHASRYQARQQQHGTSMASLIAHGDLGADGPPLETPIYVRPILVPFEDFSKNVVERTPDDRLLVDIIHEAVVRIKGTGDRKGEAPTVKVINLSFGNTWQPFDRQMSPLAKLLDWLSWEYNVLFLVSAGNQSQTIDLDAENDELNGMTEEEFRAKALEAIRQDQLKRRPFSPAEAMNVLTVGATHADHSSWDQVGNRIDLLKGARLPSPLSTVANGFKRSVKPDIYFPGGRQLYQKDWRGPSFKVAHSSLPPGLRVAAPGARAMELGRTTHSRGTSNATALASRTAGLIHSNLEKLRSTPGGDLLSDEYTAVILKALLVHGASWGEAGDIIENVLGGGLTKWQDKLRLKSRFLGYGEVDPERALFSTDQRVAMLGWQSLTCGSAHVFRVPLPPSLSGKKVKRRLTISLAWFSPINPHHKDYRRASLWFSSNKDVLALDKKDLDYDSAKRGTVQHQIFEGDTARAFSDGDAIEIKVSCAEDAGSCLEKIPYALAATLEIAEPIDLKIFREVEARIRMKVGINPTGT